MGWQSKPMNLEGRLPGMLTNSESPAQQEPELFLPNQSG